LSLPELPLAGGNGLLHRRVFLAGGVGAAALRLLRAVPAGAAAQQDVPAWMRAPGQGMRPYGSRSPYEASVQRLVAPVTGTVGTGSSRTPLEHLEGMITPSALHFERHHSGVPDIPPDQHRLLIHGLVERPLTFDLAALSRYPLVSQVHFIEGSGNSGGLYAAQPPPGTAGALHGLVSCSEWTGIPLGTLLEEAGARREGRWLLAEGGDAAAMSRSIPIDKALDDALVAIYQNGERLRPEQGYPMRLLLPGWEGNTNVKWLRRLKVTAGPTMTKDETSKYTDLLEDGLGSSRFRWASSPSSRRRRAVCTCRGRACIRSPGSRGRAAGASVASTCRPTEGTPGPKRRCPIRCCRRR
jgi:sulfane dehydrogenase subunit SoxC